MTERDVLRRRWRRVLAVLPGRFRRDESGAGTVFALFGIAICFLLAGVAADFGNAWRQREVLRLSADVAAHAAVGVLAKGGSVTGAMSAAMHATELNTPERKFGRVIYDAVEDVRLLHYDPDSNRTSLTGPVNAVSVRLQRNDRSRNSVPTYFLGLTGITDWDIVVESVAAVLPTERCRNSDGLFAHGAITLNGESMVGPEVCIHSQDKVLLPQSVIFAAGSRLSMPDMADCGGLCNDMASPGYNAASASVNLIMPPTAPYVTRLAEGLVDTKETLPEETAFFARHPLAEDLSPLDEVGVKVADLATGDVVTLDSEAFSRLRALPAGLVYRVSCAASDDASGVLAVGAAATEAREEAIALLGINDTDSGGDEEGMDAPPPDETIPEDALPEMPRFVLDGMALVTDCALRFTQSAELRNTLVISTASGPDSLMTAEEGATAGDPDLACDPAAQAIVMTQGSVSVPASFAASNLALVSAGDVAIGGSATGAPVGHRGLSVHAGGKIATEGGHVFDACKAPASEFLPTLDVIKYVLPTDPLVTQ